MTYSCQWLKGFPEKVAMTSSIGVPVCLGVQNHKQYIGLLLTFLKKIKFMTNTTT